MAQQAAQAAKTTLRTFRELHGVVISAGKMDRTVKVRVGGQRWNNWIKKFFDNPKTYLVHDPNNSLFLGDVVAITPGWRVSASKRHVVKHIIAPGSGVPIGERAPIPSWEELHAEREARRADKAVRRQVAKTVSGAEDSLRRGTGLLKMARAELARLAGKLGVEFVGLKEVDKTAGAGGAGKAK